MSVYDFLVARLQGVIFRLCMGLFTERRNLGIVHSVERANLVFRGLDAQAFNLFLVGLAIWCPGLLHYLAWTGANAAASIAWYVFQFKTPLGQIGLVGCYACYCGLSCRWLAWATWSGLDCVRRHACIRGRPVGWGYKALGGLWPNVWGWPHKWG